MHQHTPPPPPPPTHTQTQTHTFLSITNHRRHTHNLYTTDNWSCCNRTEPAIGDINFVSAIRIQQHNWGRILCTQVFKHLRHDCIKCYLHSFAHVRRLDTIPIFVCVQSKYWMSYLCRGLNRGHVHTQSHTHTHTHTHTHMHKFMAKWRHDTV